MKGDILTQSSSINILGMEISSKLSWKPHILTVAKKASQKLGFLYRARKYFNSSQIATLCKARVRPSVKYCGQIWGSAPASLLSILDRIQNKAIRLIHDESLTAYFQSLSHRRFCLITLPLLSILPWTPFQRTCCLHTCPLSCSMYYTSLFCLPSMLCVPSSS